MCCRRRASWRAAISPHRRRTYGLRDNYRMLRYGQGTSAFKQGGYARALALFESARKPPVSLGMDDFEFQISPRLQYYLGRTLEAMGSSAEAAEAYLKGIAGMELLTGDRDSWNSENLFMVASLERLGRAGEGAQMGEPSRTSPAGRWTRGTPAAGRRRVTCLAWSWSATAFRTRGAN